MIDKAELLKRTAAYVKAHPPGTGYTLSAMKAVLEADLPAGTNILVQFAMQFTDKEEATDYVHWDKPEKRLPYSKTYRYSLDRSADCSSFWWAVYKIFFGVNIGTTTWKMYDKWHKHFIPWEQRQPGDIILYNFKKGRPASHAAGYIGGGLIQHTTNPRDRMHTEPDKYAAKHRVGVFRPVSGEKYNSLLAGGEESDMVIKTGSKGLLVEAWQRALKTLGYGIGAYGPDKDGVDGEYGDKTAAATKLFQKACGLPETGEVDNPSAAAMWGRARETEIAALGEKNQKLQGQISEALPGIKAAQSALERQP